MRRQLVVGISQTCGARWDAKGREFSAFSTRMEERRLETPRLAGGKKTGAGEKGTLTRIWKRED